jgi:hypothetical protein
VASSARILSPSASSPISSYLDPNQAGKARNDLMIAGGTVLCRCITYALAMVAAPWGRAR